MLPFPLYLPVEKKEKDREKKDALNCCIEHILAHAWHITKATGKGALCHTGRQAFGPMTGAHNFSYWNSNVPAWMKKKRLYHWCKRWSECFSSLSKSNQTTGVMNVLPLPTNWLCFIPPNVEPLDAIQSSGPASHTTALSFFFLSLYPLLLWTSMLNSWLPLCLCHSYTLASDATFVVKKSHCNWDTWGTCIYFAWWLVCICVCEYISVDVCVCVCTV